MAGLGLVAEADKELSSALVLSDSCERDWAYEFLNNSSDGIVAFDRDYQCVFCNHLMERISGMALEDMVGKSAFSIFPQWIKTGEYKYFGECLAGNSAVSKSKPYTVAGATQKQYFDGHYFPLTNAEGRIVGGVAIFRDVTQREQAVTEAGRELAGLQEALELETLNRQYNRNSN